MWIRRVGAEVKALGYGPDGTLYTVDGGRVSAWDIASRKPTRVFYLHGVQASNVSAIYVLGGRYLLVSTNDARVGYPRRTNVECR